jgi:hypothetical protein
MIPNSRRVTFGTDREFRGAAVVLQPRLTKCGPSVSQANRPSSVKMLSWCQSQAVSTNLAEGPDDEVQKWLQPA